MNRIIIIISSRNEYIKMYIYCVNKQKRSSGHQGNKLISAFKEFAVRMNQRSMNSDRQSNFLNKTERTKNYELELITLSSIKLKMSGNFLCIEANYIILFILMSSAKYEKVNGSENDSELFLGGMIA